VAPNSITESELGSWVIRVGMFVIAFFLALGVKDAKKSLDQIPGLVAHVEALEKALDAAFTKIGKLEEELRK
jgi:hypothetical protein